MKKFAILGGVFLLVFLISFASAWDSSLDENLIAYYNFEETSGNLIDSLGNFNGTVGSSITQGVTGKIGNAYSSTSESNIDNSKVIVGDIGQDVLGVSLWFYNDKVYPQTAFDFDYLMYFDTNQYVLFSGYGGFVGDISLYRDSTTREYYGGISVGWHHLVLSKDGSVPYQIWLDGVRVDNSGSGVDLNFSGGNVEFFGGWVGDIDEVALYSQSLNSTIIGLLYNSGSGVTYSSESPNNIPIINNEQTTVNVYATDTYSFDYNVTDVDEDNLIYYDNTTLFDINSSTGEILDIPTSGERGSYEILITVSDGIVNVTDSFTYNILNNIPVINNEQTSVTLEIGEDYTYDYNAIDLDLDSLTYYDDTSLFNINSSTGEISLTGTTSEDVGFYSITISVSDGIVNTTDSFTIAINNAVPPPATSSSSSSSTTSSEVFLIGGEEEIQNLFSLTSISIEDIRACSENGYISFRPEDSDGNILLIPATAIKLKIDNVEQDVKVSYDAKKEEYYFDLNDLKLGNAKIVIEVTNGGSRIIDSREVEIINCFDANEYLNEVTTKTRRFFEENQWSIAVGMIVLVGIVFLIVLAGKKSS